MLLFAKRLFFEHPVHVKHFRELTHLARSNHTVFLGLQSQQHEVTHIISKMCVVRRSTALIPCRYSRLKYEHLHTGKWLYRKLPEESARDVLLDPAFEGRVQFTPSVNDGGNCSLMLRDVRDSDAGIFHFAFRTDVSAQNWTNSSGVSLEVTGALNG